MKCVRFFCVIICIVLCASFAGCTTNKGNSGTDSEPIDAKQEMSGNEFLRDYIKKMETNEDRNSFYPFWNEVYYYCVNLENELNSISNEKHYEFDPVNGEIPAEVKDIYDFESIRYSLEVLKHEDYKLVIDKDKVSFHFDGLQFYPTEETPLSVVDIVEEYNE